MAIKGVPYRCVKCKDTIYMSPNTVKSTCCGSKVLRLATIHWLRTPKRHEKPDNLRFLQAEATNDPNAPKIPNAERKQLKKACFVTGGSLTETLGYVTCPKCLSTVDTLEFIDNKFVNKSEKSEQPSPDLTNTPEDESPPIPEE